MFLGNDSHNSHNGEDLLHNTYTHTHTHTHTQTHTHIHTHTHTKKKTVCTSSPSISFLQPSPPFQPHFTPTARILKKIVVSYGLLTSGTCLWQLAPHLWYVWFRGSHSKLIKQQEEKICSFGEKNNNNKACFRKLSHPRDSLHSAVVNKELQLKTNGIIQKLPMKHVQCQTTAVSLPMRCVQLQAAAKEVCPGWRGQPVSGLSLCHKNPAQ